MSAGILYPHCYGCSELFYLEINLFSILQKYLQVTVLRSNSQYLVIIIIVRSSAFFVQHTALFIWLRRSSFLSVFDNSSNQSSNYTRNNQCTNEYQKLITNFNHFSRSRSSLEFLKHLAIRQSDQCTTTNINFSNAPSHRNCHSGIGLL